MKVLKVKIIPASSLNSDDSHKSRRIKYPNDRQCKSFNMIYFHWELLTIFHEIFFGNGLYFKKVKSFFIVLNLSLKYQFNVLFFRSQVEVK